MGRLLVIDPGMVILGYVRMGSLSVRGKVVVLVLMPLSLRRRKKLMPEPYLDVSLW